MLDNLKPKMKLLKIKESRKEMKEKEYLSKSNTKWIMKGRKCTENKAL
jgi:hypothetical protein